MKTMKWKLVPEEPTEEMGDAGIEAWKAGRTTGTYVDDCYKAMLAAAPQPEHDRMTKEEAQAMQDWKGMDGAIAFHLIERHADGWNQVAMMMTAWLDANKVRTKLSGCEAVRLECRVRHELTTER